MSAELVRAQGTYAQPHAGVGARAPGDTIGAHDRGTDRHRAGGRPARSPRGRRGRGGKLGRRPLLAPARAPGRAVRADRVPHARGPRGLPRSGRGRGVGHARRAAGDVRAPRRRVTTI